MIKFSPPTLFRVFIILTGMIKAGYSIMMLSTVYYSINEIPSVSLSSLYYKNIGAFIGGLIFPLCLHWGVSRALVMKIEEVLFIIPTIPYLGIETREYCFLIGGGICFILYPIYAREHFLQSQQQSVQYFIWKFLVLGICYYFCMQWRDFEITQSPLIDRDFITPYIFGTISLFNLIMTFLIKYKESLQYYSLKKEDSLSIYWLIVQLFKYNYQFMISAKFCTFDQPALLNSSSYKNQQSEIPIEEFLEISEQYSKLIEDRQTIKENELEHDKINQNNYIMLLSFCSGLSGILLTSQQTLFSFLIIFQDQDQSPNEISAVQPGYYFLFLLLLAYCLIKARLFLHHQKKRIIVLSYYTLSIVIQIIIFIGAQTQNNDNKIFAFFSILLGVCFLGVISPFVFSLPFVYLNINKIVIYFTLLWVGSLINKLFLNNSVYVDDKSKLQQNYNGQIMSIIGIGISLLCFYKIKEI